MTTEIALELALRLRAEMEQGLAALSRLESGVDGVQDKTRGANAQLGQVGRAAGDIEKVAAASQRAAQGLASVDEAAEVYAAQARRQMDLEYARTKQAAEEERRAMLAAEEYLHAQEAQLAADQAAAQAIQETTRVTAEQASEMQQLMKAYDPATAALRRLEEHEKRLTKAVDEGRMSREQYLRAMTGLQTERAQWEALNSGVEKTAQSLDKVKLSANEVARSLANATSNAARGDLPGAGRSLASLGGRGAMSFGALGVAIGGTAAALGLFTVAAWRGYKQTQDLERALILTNNAVGLTSDQIQLMAGDLDDATGTIGRGREALLLLVQSGEVSADVLADAGRAAVNLAELTGQSIEQTTGLVRRLMQEPAKFALELNRQYRFLTTEIYKQVRALERQGEVQEAQRVLMAALARDGDEKLGRLRENLGYVERAWDAVAGAAKRAWDGMLGIGRGVPLETQLENLRGQIESLESASTDNALRARGHELRGLTRAQRDALAAKVLLGLRQQEAELVEQIANAQAGAQEAAAANARDQAAIEAQGRAAAAVAQDRALEKQKQEKQLAEDIAALRAEGITEVEGMGLADYEAFRRQQLEERFQDRSTPRSSNTDSAAEGQRRFVEQLERQAAVYGLNNEQLREYELAERKLTGALLERARAAAELLRQAEEQRAIDEDAQSLAAAETAYLRAIGQHQEAAERELEERYGELLERLERRGDAAGTQIVQNLFSAEKARAALQRLQIDSDRTMSNIARAEQRVGIARDAGLISNIAAQRQLLELRQQEIVELQRQIPLLEQYNSKLKDEGVAAAIEDMRLRLFELQQQASLLESTFRNTFEQGLGDALINLATGTQSVGEAMRSLIADIAEGMARLAAQQLASIATAKLMRSIFGGNEGVDVGEGAAELQTAAVATGLAGAAIKFGADALGESARELQRAAFAMLVANSMGGFAEGGYTGPGGKYQLAGFVHKDEWVHPKETVGFYGHGIMAALQNRAVPRELFTGVRAPTVAMTPRISFAEGGLARGGLDLPTPKVNLRVMNYLDSNRLAQEAASSSAWEDTIINHVMNNPSKIKASW